LGELHEAGLGLRNSVKEAKKYYTMAMRKVITNITNELTVHY
jgi:TPR repeat protein